MNPEKFRAIGEALHGPSWQLPLARALGIGGRAVRHYAAKEDARPIPDHIADALRPMLQAKAKTLLTLARGL